MAFDELMGLTNRLLANAIALAAVGARLHLDELGTDGDPAVRAQLDRVVDTLGVQERLDAIDPGERAVLVAFMRSYLAQALDLLEHPERPGAWSHSDSLVLQAQGAASSVVATLLAELGFGGRDARILDVGTGVGGIATAFCRIFPEATVVGIDPWEPALALARENVAAAELESRVTLVPSTIQDYDDPGGFDLVWLPSFFVPENVLDGALERIHALTRPGGQVVVGVTFATGGDPMESVTDDLMTVRSGGALLQPQDAIDRLRRAGFEDVREIERTWNPPLRFVAGSRA